MDELTKLTLAETLKDLKDKKFSEEELCSAYVSRAAKLNPRLNAFISLCEPYKGILAGIKDVFNTKDIKTTAGSKVLENYVPPFDSTVISRLDQHNISVLGKTNCDEFAMGSSGENSAYGATKNPWNLDKVPGGSSSGSAAAVAADMCVFSLGTDTGGSIRQPASLCGVVGLKPTYGRVSRYGVIAMASSLDCPGPVTKSVGDARTVLGWIARSDGKDSNVAYHKKDLNGSRADLHGLKVGLPSEYFAKGLDHGVKVAVEKAIKQLEDLGCSVVDITLPHTEYAVAAYYILMASEVSSNLARYDGIRFGGGRELFGPEAKRRIMLGTFALSVGYWDDYFAKAAKVRTLIKLDFEKAFEKCDVIAGPVSPTVAWNLGEKIDDPLKMYLSDIYTVPSSLAGIPGLSVPCGFVQGLPVGLQILGKHFDEETILAVGEAFEQSTNWHLEKPAINF